MERQISRGLKTLFLVYAILSTIFGLVGLLIPEMWANLVGLPIEEPVMFRQIGATALAFAASSWLAYRETAWERVKIVVQMDIVGTILATIIYLLGLLFAGAPTALWMNVVLTGGFAAAFSYFYFRG